MNNTKKKESLIEGIVKYSISTWANLIIGFLSVIVTTRILAPEEYGMVSIFLSAANFLMYIVTFGMDGAYIRFYNEPPAKNTKNQLLYKMILISTFICVILGCACTFFFYKESSMYIFGIESRLLVGMVFIYAFCQAVLRYLNINFRMGFKVKQYNIQNIMISCLSRVLVIAAAAFTDGVTYIICIVSIGTAMVLLVYLFIQKDEVIPYTAPGKSDYSMDLKHYGEFFRFSLFSAPTYFVTYFNSFMSQQIVRSSLGSYELGVFSSCGMFSSIFGALKGGFATFWSAYVYKNHATEKEKIKSMHDYALVFAIFAASFLVIARDLVFIIIGSEYHASKKFFSLLLVMPVLSLVLETTDKGIALAKKNELILLTHIVAAVTNILGCFVFIRLFGLIGAAYADAFAAIILYIANTYFGQKYYKSIKNVFRSIVGVIIIILLLVMPSCFVNMSSIIIFTLVVDIFSFVFFRKECKFILQQIFGFLCRILKINK